MLRHMDAFKVVNLTWRRKTGDGDLIIVNAIQPHWRSITIHPIGGVAAGIKVPFRFGQFAFWPLASESYPRCLITKDTETGEWGVSLHEWENGTAGWLSERDDCYSTYAHMAPYSYGQEALDVATQGVIYINGVETNIANTQLEVNLVTYHFDRWFLIYLHNPAELSIDVYKYDERQGTWDFDDFIKVEEFNIEGDYTFGDRSGIAVSEDGMKTAFGMQHDLYEYRIEEIAISGSTDDLSVSKTVTEHDSYLTEKVTRDFNVDVNLGDDYVQINPCFYKIVGAEYLKSDGNTSYSVSGSQIIGIYYDGNTLERVKLTASGENTSTFKSHTWNSGEFLVDDCGYLRDCRASEELRLETGASLLAQVPGPFYYLNAELSYGRERRLKYVIDDVAVIYEQESSYGWSKKTTGGQTWVSPRIVPYAQSPTCSDGETRYIYESDQIPAEHEYDYHGTVAYTNGSLISFGNDRRFYLWNESRSSAEYDNFYGDSDGFWGWASSGELRRSAKVFYRGREYLLDESDASIIDCDAEYGTGIYTRPESETVCGRVVVDDWDDVSDGYENDFIMTESEIGLLGGGAYVSFDRNYNAFIVYHNQAVIIDGDTKDKIDVYERLNAELVRKGYATVSREQADIEYPNLRNCGVIRVEGEIDV